MSIGIMLVASRSKQPAGGERHLLSLLEHMDRSRYRAHVLLPHHGEMEFAVSQVGARVHVVESDPRCEWLGSKEARLRYLSSLPATAKQICDILFAEDIQIVHTNSNHRLEGACAAALAQRPHVMAAHIPYGNSTPRLPNLGISGEMFATLIAALSDEIICVSDEVASSIRNFDERLSYTVIPNGIDLLSFDHKLSSTTQDIRIELGLSRDSKIVLLAGRICRDKAFDVLPDIAARLDDVHFVVAGACEEEEYHQEIVHAATDVGVMERIHFVGRRNDLPALMASADVFFLPSRMEGHPFVLLEAMAASCPLVASRCPGVAGTVDESNGYVCEIDDLNCFASSLRALLYNPQRACEMGQTARRAVESRFTATRMTEKTTEVWDRACSQSPRQRRERAQLACFVLELLSRVATDGLHYVEKSASSRKKSWLRHLLRYWTRA